MSALVPGCRTVKCKVTGTPAFTAAGTVVSSSTYSRVSNGSPGTSAIPHLRHRLPASLAVTSGCIGQNHAVVPGGAELCWAAAADTMIARTNMSRATCHIRVATSASVSLFRCIRVQRDGDRCSRRIRIRDGLQDGSGGQLHRLLENVRRRPERMRVLHPEQDLARAVRPHQLDLERSHADGKLGPHRDERL